MPMHELVDTLDGLEKHYREMQDIEFTVEDGTLFLLQTRTGKRTAQAALRIAVEMAEEDLITREEAVARIDTGQLDQLLHPRIDPDAHVEVVATGLNASPGAASGAIVLDADLAEERGRAGEDVVLVRWETTPDDIHGLIHARGVLTAHGGMTSHAAVVARGMGKPCVAGCEALSIDTAARTVTDRGGRAARGRPADDRRQLRPRDRRRGAARPSPRSTRTSRPSSGGRTTSAACASVPTPTRPPTPPRPASSAPRASASAAPSTCSWRPTGSRSSRR